MGWRHASLVHLGADQLLRSAHTVLVRGSVCVFVTMRACGSKPTTPRNSLIGVSSSCKLRRVRALGSQARWTAAACACTYRGASQGAPPYPDQRLQSRRAVGGCRQVPALLRAAAKQASRDREEGRGRRRRRRRPAAAAAAPPQPQATKMQHRHSAQPSCARTMTIPSPGTIGVAETPHPCPLRLGGDDRRHLGPATLTISRIYVATDPTRSQLLTTALSRDFWLRRASFASARTVTARRRDAVNKRRRQQETPSTRDDVNKRRRPRQCRLLGVFP